MVFPNRKIVENIRREYPVGTRVELIRMVFILRWCEKLREINKKQYRILFENEVYNIICVDDVQFTHKKLKLTAVREMRGGKNEQTGDI